MNRRTILTILLAVGFAAPAAHGENPDPVDTAEAHELQSSLTLREAQRIALQQNPSIRQGIQRIRAAEGKLRQAYSAWWPTVTARGGLYRREADRQIDFRNYERLQADLTESDVALEANWLLFNGFARRAETLAAGYGVEQTHQLQLNTRRLVTEAVATAYLQSQLAMEMMEIARKDREFNRSLEENARTRYEAGAAARTELLNFSMKALQADSDYITAQKDYQVACTVLAELMGIEGSSLPAPMQLKATRAASAEEIPDFEQSLAYALANRPDLLATEAATDAANSLKNAAKGAWMPAIAATAGFSYQKQSGFEPEIPPHNLEQYNSHVGLTARWDIFTGGRRSGAFQEKKAEALAMQAEQEKVKLEIASSLRQATLAAQTALQVRDRQEQALDMTTRIRNDIEELYRSGAATLTRLNEAQRDLVRAAGLAAASRIRLALALEKLRSETGILPETLE